MIVRLRRIIFLSLATVLVATAALAYFRTTGSGAASAAAGSLSAPTSVTATASAGSSPVSVPVSWGAAHVTPANATLDASITYSVERSANAGSTWTAAGGTCAGTLTGTSCSDSVASSGTYRYRVTAAFRSWTAAASSSDVAVTAIAQPTISSQPASVSANPAPSFSFTEGGGTGYECKLDGGSFASCTSPKSYSGLTDGSHTFTVHAISGLGTGPNATYTWTIDTSAPTIGTKPSNPSNNASPSFSFTHTRAAYTFKCKLDSGSFSVCTSPKSYSALTPDGSHTFTVEAVDADGVATSTASYSWLLDTANPSTTATGADSNWHRTAVTVALSASDPGYSATGSGVSSLHYKVDSGSQTDVAGASGTASTNVTISAPSNGSNDGDHTITYWSTDAAGNVENQNTVHVKIDVVGPTNNLSLTQVSGGAYLDGSSGTLWYDSGVAGSFTLSDAITDSGSGPASVAYPVAGTGKGPTHAAETVTTGPAYTSSAFSWTGGANFASSYTITASDSFTPTPANTSTTSVTFAPDNTNPTGSISYTPNGYLTGASVPITLSASDAGSGVGTTQLQRGETTLSNGNCGAAGSYVFTTIATFTNNPTSYNDSGVTSGHCYKYQYIVNDNVTNTVTATSNTIVKVDQTAPTTTLTFPVNGTTYSLTTWTALSTTACGGANRTCGTAADTGGSGLSSDQVQIEQNFGSHNCWSGTAWVATCNWLNATGTTSWTFTIAPTSFAVPALSTQSFIFRARSTDNAGNVSSSASSTFSLSNP